jgi:exodeoxyribonuclease III
MEKDIEQRNKSVKIVSWNVNGLRAIYKKGFRDFIMHNDFDILCLQEIKINKEKILKEIKSPEGYLPYFSCALRPGYSGVATYTKIMAHNAGYGFGIPHFDDEGRVLWQEYKDFILFNTYMPNGGRDKKRLAYKMEFYYEFLDYLKRLLKAGKNIIVTGDINTAHKPIDLARPRQNENNTGFLPEERQWIDRLLDAGFLDAFRLFNSKPQNYTWWDYKTHARQRNVGWRIDYFFISKGLEKKVKQCSIMPDVMGSDHCPIYLEIYY